jgi:adenylate cyclase
MRLRDWISGAVVALVVGGAVGLLSDRLSGPSVDHLFWLRERFMPVAWDRARSPAAIIAIDEETYHRPPFTTIPNALWTREIAGVLNALVDADAKVVGFDVIFPTSIERFVPGFDRDFLLALQHAAAVDKVVLGEVRHHEYPIHPFAAQSIAVGNERNIRSDNLFQDDDGVIRRIPLRFERQGTGPAESDRMENSMALELAARASGAEPKVDPSGGLMLGQYAIPGSTRDAMLVNFEGADAIPTYSLADLVSCAQQGKTEFFRSHFAGKVVMIGAVLDVEDRKTTSMRLITAPEHESSATRCVLAPLPGIYGDDVVRDSIPGVYVLATAVNNLLLGDALRELPGLEISAIVVALALGTAWVSLYWEPAKAAIVIAAGVVIWATGAAFAFREGLVLPLIAAPAGAALTYATILGYRYVVTDRDKRLLKASFGYYLPSPVIDRLLNQDRLPELGGELCTATVLFSDIAGFTTLSERMAATDLVTLTNAYLSEMTAIIESEGGFIDKYIGDAILAIFGAPVIDKDHALHAARAALRCRDRLAILNATPGAFRGESIEARIALSTGEVVVGNVGSRGRFNYTVMADTVNLAARIEDANKIYGTPILASTAVRDASGDAIEWREIDRIRVRGRDQSTTIFEPLAMRGELSAEQNRRAARFAEALAAYRAGHFEAALAGFEALSTTDCPSRTFARRIQELLRGPPGVPEQFDPRH